MLKNKAVMVVHKMSADEKLREIAGLREKALRDEASAMYGAEKKGRAEGRAEGREEIIAKMRSKGMTEEQIKELLE